MFVVAIGSFTCYVPRFCFVHQTNIEDNGLMRMFEARPSTTEAFCAGLKVNIVIVSELKISMLMLCVNVIKHDVK